MGNLDSRQEHLAMLSETGRIRLTKDQKKTIDLLMGDSELSLENPDPDSDATMDLPTLGKRFP